MKVFLETQAFLWFVTDDPCLSGIARATIEDPDNERTLSIASVWEMAIKHRINKLHFTDPFNLFIINETNNNSITLLPIAVEHAMAVAYLPLHHRDPFDRLLIVQALAEKMTMVSSDEVIDQYGLTRIW